LIILRERIKHESLEPDPAGGNSEFSLVGCDNGFVPQERELTLYSLGQGVDNIPEENQKVAEGEIIDLGRRKLGI